ncbi:MAG: hypothetical protein IT267_08615 [Saprospiraceae bacterium]|nr:hypothetical protein [Saprospiraceae bacterium]
MKIHITCQEKMSFSLMLSMLVFNIINSQNNLSYSYKVNEIQTYSISNGTLPETLSSYDLAGCQSYNKIFYNQYTLVNNKVNTINQLLNYEGWKDPWLPDIAKTEISNGMIRTYDSQNQLLHSEPKSELEEYTIQDYSTLWHKIGTETHLFTLPSSEELISMNINGNNAFFLPNGSLLILNNDSQTQIDYINSIITTQELVDNIVKQQTINQYINAVNGEKYLSKRIYINITS